MISLLEAAVAGPIGPLASESFPGSRARAEASMRRARDRLRAGRFYRMHVEYLSSVYYNMCNRIPMEVLELVRPCLRY